TLTITVNDNGNTGSGGSQEASETVTLTVTAVNDAPTDIALSSISVNQSAGVNAEVGTFSTTDPDTDDTHTYALVTGVGDDNNNLCNIAGSTLRVNDASVLQAGGAPYTVRIRSTDDQGAFYERAFV